MNGWIEKSIELANSPGYLDNLSNIYEMQVNPERPLPPKIVPEVKVAYEAKDSKKLINLLIRHAAVFPVKDSYIGFLRAKPRAIDENPVTVERIANRLYSLGFDLMVKEASRSKETNRQLGQSFKTWVPRMGYPLVDVKTILESKNKTLVLDGSDKLLGAFARTKLNCKLTKGIDLVVKKNEKYIIGEAKFLTTPGGEQDRGFDDASHFINEKTGNASRIAVLDGYIWLNTKKGLHEKIKKANDNILSALLLREFIEDFR